MSYSTVKSSRPSHRLRCRQFLSGCSAKTRPSLGGVISPGNIYGECQMKVGKNINREDIYTLQIIIYIYRDLYIDLYIDLYSSR